MKNWKTTYGGAGAIFGALGVIFNMLYTGMFDAGQLGAAVMGISGGIGLIFAKDHNVTGGSVAQ